VLEDGGAGTARATADVAVAASPGTLSCAVHPGVPTEVRLGDDDPRGLPRKLLLTSADGPEG
jgi:hypothetical protein